MLVNQNGDIFNLKIQSKFLDGSEAIYGYLYKCLKSSDTAVINAVEKAHNNTNQQMGMITLALRTVVGVFENRSQLESMIAKWRTIIAEGGTADLLMSKIQHWRRLGLTWTW